jgi:hypothetical protein
MKLQELAQPKQSRTIAEVFESYFNDHVTVDRFTASQARRMLGKVRAVLSEQRQQTSRHNSHQNASYMKLVMLEQMLATKLEELAPPPAQQPTAPAATQKPATTNIDPNKLKAAQDKLAKGQTLTNDEQSLINTAAANQQKMQEARLRRAMRTLKESEVQQAQVVLAAQDLVDSLQGMIEDATEMQYKELPALVGSIRDQVGQDQSNQFNTDATAALSGLVQSLQTAKQQMDQALGVVTGQAPAMPGGDLGAAPGAPAVPGAEPAMPGAELPPQDDAEAMPEPEEPAGSAGALGRERR